MLKKGLSSRDKGFSLVELVVVIFILFLLSIIAVLRLYSAVEASQKNTDRANLRILNGVTSLYSILNPPGGEDIFHGIGDDTGRMQVLVDAGFLDSILEETHPDSAFTWSVGGQFWWIDGDFPQVAAGSISSYDFSNISDQDFRDNFKIWSPVSRDWAVNEDGLSPLGNGEHRVFLGAPLDEYSIKVSAALGEGRDSNPRGGYGIMFETSLDDNNRDTGYILQFDRGYGGGELVIRERSPDFSNDAQENTSPLFRFSDRDKLPGSQDDPDWWSGEREIELKVSNLAGGVGTNNKKLEVYIDGVFMFEWEFQSDIQDPSHNHTGLRTWHEGAGTYFKELEISNTGN